MVVLIIVLVIGVAVWMAFKQNSKQEADKKDAITFMRTHKDEVADFEMSVDDEHLDRYSKSAGILGAAALGPLGLFAGSAFKHKKDRVKSIAITVFYKDGNYKKIEFLGDGKTKYKWKSIIAQDADKRAKEVSNELKSYIIQNQQSEIE